MKNDKGKIVHSNIVFLINVIWNLIQGIEWVSKGGQIVMTSKVIYARCLVLTCRIIYLTKEVAEKVEKTKQYNETICFKKKLWKIKMDKIVVM